MEPPPRPGDNQCAAPGRQGLSLTRAVGRTCDGVGVTYERLWVVLLTGWLPFRGFEPGRRPPRFGDVVRSLARLRRRRAVPLATGTKIGPVDLSGSSPLSDGQCQMIVQQ